MKLSNDKVIACVVLYFVVAAAEKDEDDPAVKLPSLCEGPHLLVYQIEKILNVCKFFVTELNDRLKETNTKEVLHTGHGLDTKKKRIQYNKSELRLIEAVENPHICEKILKYNVHKERSGSNRFAKGRSETMETLHGLVDKGVKVDLGIPHELWDHPSVEVTDMQRKCYKLAEDYEDDIHTWYFKHQDKDLANYLCRNIVLGKSDSKCLDEIFVPKGDEHGSEKTEEDKKKDVKSNTKVKGDKGEKTDKKGRDEL